MGMDQPSAHPDTGGAALASDETGGEPRQGAGPERARGFYGDPAAFDALRAKVLPLLVPAEGPARSLRVWVPCCGTGEEAYTLAIELSEALRSAGVDLKFRVIATDSRLEMIERASAGVFAPEALAQLPEDLKERYFRRSGERFLIDPALRRNLIFSRHDVLRDPPFVQLDLIVCRSLLAGLDAEARARVLSMFLFGLQEGGALVLGQADDPGALPPGIEALSAELKIFRRTALPGGEAGTGARLEDRPQGRAGAEGTPGQNGYERTRRAHDILLQRYLPASFLLDGRGRLLRCYGEAQAYVTKVRPVPGSAPELQVDPVLRAAIDAGLAAVGTRARGTWDREVALALPGGEVHRLQLSLEWLEGQGPEAILHLRLRRLGDDPGAVAQDRAGEADRLPPDALRPIAEDPAGTTDDRVLTARLRLAHEDVLRTNQDLHAVNQELVAVMAESERRIDALSELNRDMDLALAALRIGLLVLDEDLRLGRYSPHAGSLLGLTRQDLFRGIGELSTRLGLPELSVLARKAAERNRMAQGEGLIGETPVTLRALPSGAGGGQPGGVLLTIQPRDGRG